MSGIDQQRHYGYGDEIGSAGKKTDQYELHGACVNRKTDKKSPYETEPCFLQKQAECDSQKQITEQNRDGFFKGGFQKLVHTDKLYYAKKRLCKSFATW